MLKELERRLGRFAIPRLTMLLVGGQVLVFFLAQAEPKRLENLSLIFERVTEGEYWRLLTFLFLPPGTGILTLFCLYFFFLMGNALEAQWGDFRYNLYVGIAYLATLCAAWPWPDMPATNAFIGGSVFLAFAYLFPNFEILLFFILPVKVKWLALLTWIGFAYAMIVGDWTTRALEFAAVCNFFLFFGSDIFWRVKAGKRRMEAQVQHIKQQKLAFHTCTICGATEKESPQMDFRYCSKCSGSHEYCELHLRNHEHR